MRTLLLLPLVYVAAVLQTSLADVVRVGRVEPDLLAVLAVGWLLVFPGPRSFLAAGLAGLAADLISPGRIGVAAFCFLLVGYGVMRLRARLPIRHLVWQVAVVGVAVSLIAAGSAMGRWLLGETTAAPSVLLVRSLSVGVYSAGVSLPLLMVVGWMQEPLRRRKGMA
jgi:rod shape-determining protein MreD